MARRSPAVAKSPWFALRMLGSGPRGGPVKRIRQRRRYEAIDEEPVPRVIKREMSGKASDAANKTHDYSMMVKLIILSMKWRICYEVLSHTEFIHPILSSLKQSPATLQVVLGSCRVLP